MSAVAMLFPMLLAAQDFDAKVTHGYADSDGVKIHYASMGSGPLVVMVHGFPDYWYTWRHQMAGLADRFQVVAIDQRGYNLSDQPKGDASYAMRNLVGDVIAVIKSLGKDKAIVVGHDWGPYGLGRELATNPAQQKASEYARGFQKPGSEAVLQAEKLASWVKDPAARAKYVEAFRKSDFAAMMAYYRVNYPREPYQAPSGELKKVAMPVLLFHGLDDWALLPGALNNTWDWIGNDLTLMTIPGSGHFVQQDAAEKVTRMMRAWLLQ